MRDDTKAARRKQIEAAAYVLLEEKGYGATSMLAVAKRAKASNETLYNWYGDKLGLFKALVAGNALEIKRHLLARSTGDDPMQTLGTLGPLLLGMLLGERAIALNRAAAADPTGELGHAIAAEGRDTVAPLVTQTIEQAGALGALTFDSAALVTEVYLSLLIGDLQIRRAIGRIPEPDAQECEQRSDRAIEFLSRLYGQHG